MPQRLRLPPLREALGYEAAPEYFDTIPRSHHALCSRPDDYAGYPSASAYAARPSHPVADPFQVNNRSGPSRSLRDDPALQSSYTSRDPWTGGPAEATSPPPRGRKHPLHSSMQRTPSPPPRNEPRHRTQKARRMSPPLSPEYSLRDQSPPGQYSHLLPSQRSAQKQGNLKTLPTGLAGVSHQAPAVSPTTPDLSSLSLDHMSEDEAPVRTSRAPRSSVSPPIRSPRPMIAEDSRTVSPVGSRFLAPTANALAGVARSSPFAQFDNPIGERNASGMSRQLRGSDLQDTYPILSRIGTPLSMTPSSSTFGRRASEPVVVRGDRAASLPPTSAAAPPIPALPLSGTYPASGLSTLPLFPLRSPSPPRPFGLRSAKSTHFGSPTLRLPPQPPESSSSYSLHRAASAPHSDNPMSPPQVRYFCEVCGKAFARPSGVTIQMVVHTGERAYQCSQCMRSFGTASNLRRHQKLHQEDSRRLASP